MHFKMYCKPNRKYKKMTVIDEEEWGRWQKMLFSEGVWINIVLKALLALASRFCHVFAAPTRPN